VRNVKTELIFVLVSGALAALVGLGAFVAVLRGWRERTPIPAPAPNATDDTLAGTPLATPSHDAVVRVVWWVAIAGVLVGIGISNAFATNRVAIYALGGAAVFGDLGKTTTIREIQAAASPAASTAISLNGARPSINDIYKRAAPGVVQVTSTTIVNVPPDPFFGNPLVPQQQRQQSLGSGFVVDKAGHIVTNFHVVDGAKQVRVSFSNGASMKATVVGTDPSSDLAVLKIDASSRALTPLPLGDSDQMKVGDAVVAIGNPFGLDRTVTSGIVSAPISAGLSPRSDGRVAQEGKGNSTTSGTGISGCMTNMVPGFAITARFWWAADR